MTDETILNAKQQRLMRRWFKKTGENTIELKERRWGIIKFFFMTLVITWVYYDFIDLRYQDMTLRELQYSFQPVKAFEKSWEFYQDYDNPNITKAGQSKEDFMKESWDEYKSGDAWIGFFIVGKYILCFLFGAVLD